MGALLPPDGGDCEALLDQFRGIGIDINALATQLQTEGVREFDQSWEDLMACLATKSQKQKKAG